jgi:hypothetical protein
MEQDSFSEGEMNGLPAAGAVDSQAIPLAVDIGWTMAVLFGQLRPGSVADRLPTEHELPPDQRAQLEVARVNSLLLRLGALLPTSPAAPTAPAGPAWAPEVPQLNLPASGDGGDAAGGFAATGRPDDSVRQTLANTNLAILKWLARAGREFGLAYQLGRSLRDTANPPLRGQTDTAAAHAEAARAAVTKQLSRSRVSTLQEWLATLAPRLPADSAAIVSASIGRWCDVAMTIFDPQTPGQLRGSQSQPDVAVELVGSLLPQGDAWVNLLVGAESSEGLLTPEGFVAAAEAALGRSARIIRRIAVHYWFVLLILAIAVAAALYFADRDIAGAGKVWTQIAAVSGGLGITVKGMGAAMARFSEDAEKPIFGLEKIDAMAWAVTTIPGSVQKKLDGQGVRVLRRSGIPAPGPLGRV